MSTFALCVAGHVPHNLRMGNTDVIEAWLAWCADEGHSTVTTAEYRRTLHRVAAFHGGDILAATDDSLRAWLRTHDHCRPATRRAYVVRLIGFYTWVHARGLTASNPTADIRRPKAPSGKPRPLTEQQYRRVVAMAEGRMLCWVLLGGDAGLRRQEIARVEREHVNGRRLHVVGKGARHRIVPMSMRLTAAIEAWPVSSGRLWPLSDNRVGVLIRSHLLRCGVDATAHQLRHTAGTAFYRASGGDLLRTAAFLGHASATTTQVYAAFADDLDAIVDGMAA